MNNGFGKVNQRGFTLIEVMLVIVLIGLMVSVIQFNFGSNKPQEQLQQQTERFVGVFDVAVEYSMLNNVDMGIYVEENTYQFLGYDGTKWAEIPSQKAFIKHALPEGIEFTLTLDDLPIEEPLLFDASTFKPEDDDFIEQKDKPTIPQVYILSGGDITPFSVLIALDEDAIYQFDLEQTLGFRVTGIYSTPLTVEGPVLDE